jgi:hypothetical protein
MLLQESDFRWNLLTILVSFCEHSLNCHFRKEEIRFREDLIREAIPFAKRGSIQKEEEKSLFNRKKKYIVVAISASRMFLFLWFLH